MAVRIRKLLHDEETRLKIKSSQLINALHNHILVKGNLSPSQVNAALGLLRKTIPDLGMLQVSGDANNPLEMIHRIERVIVPVGGNKQLSIEHQESDPEKTLQ